MKLFTGILFLFIFQISYSQKLKKYEDSKNNFIISLPNNWKIKKFKDQNIKLYSTFKDKKNIIASMQIEIYDFEKNDINALFSTVIKNVGYGLKELMDKDEIDIGENHYYTIKSRNIRNKGSEIISKSLNYFNILNGKGIILTFIVENENDYEKFELQVLEMVSSFEIKI
jgi:hypothetical protein